MYDVTIISTDGILIRNVMTWEDTKAAIFAALGNPNTLRMSVYRITDEE